MHEYKWDKRRACKETLQWSQFHVSDFVLLIAIIVLSRLQCVGLWVINFTYDDTAIGAELNSSFIRTFPYTSQSYLSDLNTICILVWTFWVLGLYVKLKSKQQPLWAIIIVSLLLSLGLIEFTLRVYNFNLIPYSKAL